MSRNGSPLLVPLRHCLILQIVGLTKIPSLAVLARRPRMISTTGRFKLATGSVKIIGIRALHQNLFRVLRLEAEVFERNDASARALKKAGYTFEAKKKNAIENMVADVSVLVYCKFRHGYRSILVNRISCCWGCITATALPRFVGIHN